MGHQFTLVDGVFDLNHFFMFSLLSLEEEEFLVTHLRRVTHYSHPTQREPRASTQDVSTEPSNGGGNAPTEGGGGGSPSATAQDPGAGARQLAWLPATAASIGLRLAALDAALVYRDGETPWRDTAPVRGKRG